MVMEDPVAVDSSEALHRYRFVYSLYMHHFRQPVNHYEYRIVSLRRYREISYQVHGHRIPSPLKNVLGVECPFRLRAFSLVDTNHIRGTSASCLQLRRANGKAVSPSAGCGLSPNDLRRGGRVLIPTYPSGGCHISARPTDSSWSSTVHSNPASI